MRSHFSKLGKALAMAGLFAFLFLGVRDQVMAYSHPTESCAQHSLDIHDCHDHEAGHSRDSDKKDDHCALGHCHASHGGWVAGPRVLALFSAASREIADVSIVSAYLNPFLSKPLQPPRA